MHGEALYNAGLALQALDWEQEAAAAWRSYLQSHRTGRLAVNAARLLNGVGDFSYRVFPIGKRFVVGPSPGFRKDTPDMGLALIEALSDIGRYIRANEALELHVVAFVKNDAKLAEARARTVKRFIGAKFPDIPPRRVRIRWFGQAETILTGNKNDNQKASINFFTGPKGRENQ